VDFQTGMRSGKIGMQNKSKNRGGIINFTGYPL
jgi:hypothetical protein